MNLRISSPAARLTWILIREKEKQKRGERETRRGIEEDKAKVKRMKKGVEEEDKKTITK